jgi:hypothetical protein
VCSGHAALCDRKSECHVRKVVCPVICTSCTRLALRQALTLCSFLMPTCSHLQSLLGIQTVDPLRVYFPTLALQQDRQAPVAVPYPAAGQLPHTHPQCLMAFSMMLVTEGHARNRNQPRRMALTQLVDLLDPLGKLAPCPRPYNFLRRSPAGYADPD